MKIHGISVQDLKEIKEILKDYKNVYFFGSRTKGSYKKFSDLDICFKEDISDYEYELLKEKFEKSDLPFKVDIIQYNKISNSFKKIIDREGIQLSKFVQSRYSS